MSGSRIGAVIVAAVLMAVISASAFAEGGEPLTTFFGEVGIERTAPVNLVNIPHEKLTTAGTNVNVSGLAGHESEVSIDINPTNPLNLVIVGHSPISNGPTTAPTMNTFYTLDGGATWTLVALGNAQDGRTSNLRFDPALVFDANGNLYVAYGVAESSPNQTVLVVATSTDGGQTYTQFVNLSIQADLSVPGNDKWMMATGPHPTVPLQENLYIAWTQNVSESGLTDQRIVVSSSTDGGATFSAPAIINDASVSGTSVGNLFADPAVGPNGELYVAWHDIPNNQVLIDASLDAGVNWGTDNFVTTSNAGFKTSVPPQPSRGVHVGPTIDTDRSGGPFNGRIYLTYTDLGAGGLPDVDIFVRSSNDGGANWTNAVQVNNDGGTNTQFLPWLDVDQLSGKVAVCWYDARNDANNKKVEAWLGDSSDGGASFPNNVRVSDGQSDQSFDNASALPQNYLEYIGVVAHDCQAYLVWADNSTDSTDLDYFFDAVALTDAAPVVVCSAPVTVECRMFCGTPADDAQLVDFFNGFSATDDCDDALDTTFEHPLCFPVGTTPVIFTATDDAGNASSCTTSVTVEDTTDPEIEVVLNRTVLWPPNHKMSLICADVTVSDLCDSMPTFELVSITSNEPDNGKGDGNTTGDINIISDTKFALRSERRGGGDGRKYTGFGADGTDFDPSLDQFALVVLSQSAMWAYDVDGNLILIRPAFDATAMDLSEVYVGNALDALRPTRSVKVEIDGDGLVDLAVFYPRSETEDLIERSQETKKNSKINRHFMGPIGLHYTGEDGRDFLVENIFNLGEPVPLFPTLPPNVVSDKDAPRHGPGLTVLPNPFNPTTTVAFHLDRSERISLRVYDARGALVRTLRNDVLAAGEHRVEWNGRDNTGRSVATGVYFLHFVAGKERVTRKVVMLK
jgi:hypothetical protein